MGGHKPVGERRPEGGTVVKFTDDEWDAIESLRSSVKEQTGFTVTVTDVVRVLISEAIKARRVGSK